MLRNNLATFCLGSVEQKRGGGERAPPAGLTVFCALCSPQVMVTNVTSLLKTVKAVEDEATRGTRALEATIECIKQELTVRRRRGRRGRRRWGRGKRGRGRGGRGRRRRWS